MYPNLNPFLCTYWYIICTLIYNLYLDTYPTRILIQFQKYYTTLFNQSSLVAQYTSFTCFHMAAK